MSLNYHRAGSGEPLVLIHGIGSNWRVWNPVLPRVEPYRDTIAVDLPGFGASALLPHDTPQSIDALTDAVIGLFDQLGLERPHVAGNSLGGLLSLELAKRGRAASATALSPAGFWRNPFDAAYTSGSLRATMHLTRLLRPFVDSLLKAPGARIAVLGQVFGHPTRVPPEDAADAIRSAADAPAFGGLIGPLVAHRLTDGEAITVPVTIAWAQLDRLLLPGQAARAARVVPQARSIWLHGCGHVPTYDDPEQVAGVLLEGSTA
jgi:pimeloyl-ACP methyl ester carboxylesterase